MPRKHSAESALKIMQASDFLPISAYPGSGKPWKSKCLRCSEVVQPSLNAVQSGKRQCGFCSGARVKPSTAELVLTSAGVSPITAFPGANKPWQSKCNDCEKIITPTYANIKNGHKACAYCSGKKVEPSDAENFMLSNNLKPLEPFRSASSKWNCTCLLCDSAVSPRYSDIRRGQGGCVRCGYVESANKSKLGSEFALETMHRAGVEPLEEYQGYDIPWRSKCMSCKLEVSPRLHSILGGQGACKYCGGKEVDVNFAEKVMKEAGFTVLKSFPGANKRWESICNKCERTVHPTYGNVKKGSGCKYCNANSFRTSEPAIIYLVTNDFLRAHKIGVSNINRLGRSKKNAQNSRLEEHIRLNFTRGSRILRLVIDLKN